MFKLVKLELRKFMSFAEVKIDFSQQGFWIIQGFNSKGNDSNGAGKTALLAGIVWILFGKTQSGLMGKDVVQWGEVSCTGILELRDEKMSYQIVRTTTSLEFFIGEEKQDGHKKDLQTLINNTFGTDYTLFTTFNVFTKDWQRFITEQGDAGRKKLFKSILMLDKLDYASKKAKDIYANINVQANKTEGVIKQLTNTLPELEELLHKNQELADNEDKVQKETIEELKKQKTTLKPKILDLSEDLKAIVTESEEIKKQKLNEALEYCNIQLTNISNLIYNDSVNIKDLKNRIIDAESLEGDCPCCGQKITAKNKNIHKRHLEILQDNYTESLKDNKTEQDKINNNIYTIENTLSRLSELDNKKNVIERQLWEQNIKVEEWQKFCKMADKSIEQMAANRTDYSKIINLTQSKINKTKIGLEYNQNLFDNFLKEIDVFNYLIWLYSRQGVINLIIEKAFKRLEWFTNKYLRKICLEKFRIEISGQKQLKSGDYKEEIDIFIWDGNQKVLYAALSAGQQQRVNIAILFALVMWGKELGVNNFDFILLDEILDLSLAEKGQEDTLELLHNMKSSINHLILISHKDGLKGYFDKEIQIVRDENGISRLG